MPEEAFRAYTTLQSRIATNGIREINQDIESINSTLSDTLSLLIRVQRDVERYLEHNPCQVCATLLAARNWAARRREGDHGSDAPIPVPPPHYSPSNPSAGGGGGVPGSGGGGVEKELVSESTSLPSLVPNSTSSSDDYHTGDEVSLSSSNSWWIFADPYRYNF